MKKLLSILLAAAMLIIPGCGQSDSHEFTITCTTYPVYLLCQKVVEGIDGVHVTLLIDQQISCVHDYSLSVNDMKKLENSDVVLINGGGFEFFLDDIDLGNRTVCDCSAGIPLLSQQGHHDGHDHQAEDDPHIWLDPENAAAMAVNIAEALSTYLPSDTLSANAESYGDSLLELKARLNRQLSDLSCRQLITFHDGFAYFASAFGLTVVRSIEEEAGSEASAAEMAEIISLIKDNNIPAIFTEVNGSTATAEAISRETGVVVASLNMMISRPDTESDDPYRDIITANVQSIIEALG